MLKEQFELVQSDGLSYYIDTLGSPLKMGEYRVYPYFDEGRDLLTLAQRLAITFDYAVDAFAGGGHSLLPLLKQELLEMDLVLMLTLVRFP